MIRGLTLALVETDLVLEGPIVNELVGLDVVVLEPKPLLEFVGLPVLVLELGAETVPLPVKTIDLLIALVVEGERVLTELALTVLEAVPDLLLRMLTEFVEEVVPVLELLIELVPVLVKTCE